METITELIKGIGIKSIQFGISNMSKGEITLPISLVDETKTIVIVESTGTYAAGGTERPYVKQINRNSITFENGMSSTTKFSYQIIEFK